MTTLADGSFLYLNDRGQLYVEKREATAESSSSSSSSSFELMYGGQVIAFACHGALIALVLPRELGLGHTNTGDEEPKTVLRVYAVAGGALTDVVDEMETPAATAVVWASGGRYLVATNQVDQSTILELKNKKLRKHVTDKGVYPFSTGRTLCLTTKDMAVFWDMSKDRVADTYDLPNRRGKRGAPRQATGGCAADQFGFILNNDATLHAVYITNKGIRRVTPMLSDFVCTRRGKEQPDETRYTSVMAVSTSATQVVVAIPGRPEAVQYQYNKRAGSLKAVAKAELPPGSTVVALAKTRCLVYETDAATKKMHYRVEPLVLTPLKGPQEGDAAATHKAAAEKPAKGNKKEKAKGDRSAGGEGEESNGSRGAVPEAAAKTTSRARREAAATGASAATGAKASERKAQGGCPAKASMPLAARLSLVVAVVAVVTVVVARCVLKR